MTELHGFQPRGVVELMRGRAAAVARGEPWRDNRRLALVIEGGGMRSVCSGAGVVALSQLGFGEVFDEVAATSGGVMNAGYFLSDQVELGMRVYFENCVRSEFLSYWRPWKMLDIDYIIEQVAVRDKPLDFERLGRSRTQFLVSVCDIRAGAARLIDARASATPLLQVLRGAMAAPVFYNQVVPIDGVPCIDGGTLAPFALDEVIARGCTDILVLATRPAGFVEQPPDWFQRTVFQWAFSRGLRELAEAFAERHLRSQQVRDLALGKTGPPDGVRIAAFCSDPDASISNGTTRLEETRRAAERYGRQVRRVFDDIG